MGAYERRPPSPPAQPVPLPQPKAANYLETHTWLRAGGNSKAVKLEKKPKKQQPTKKVLCGVCATSEFPKAHFVG